MGASGYAAAWVETKGGVEPLVVPTNHDGTIGYYAVAFVRADSPYKSLDDLKGKTWAWVEPNSSSGYLFPLVGFRKMGLEPGQALRQGGVLGRTRAEHHRRARQVLRRRPSPGPTTSRSTRRGGLHMMLERAACSRRRTSASSGSPT